MQISKETRKIARGAARTRSSVLQVQMSALRGGWFKLHCYILKNSESSFHVDIADEATVSELKEAILIKNENTLVDMDGHQLKI